MPICRIGWRCGGVLEPYEHALVAVAIQKRREAVLPTAIGPRRDVWHGALALDLVTDRVAVVAPDRR